MSDEPPVIDDTSLANTGLVDAAEVRRAMEYYQSRGWTDGLPVVPVTASYLSEFLATTARDPDEVLIPLPHLNKALTVRGAFSVDAAGYENAIKLIESGQFPLDKMQTHKYGLDDVEHAIQLLAGEVPGEDGIHVAIMPGL